MDRYHLFYETVIKLAIIGKILYMILALKFDTLKWLWPKKKTVSSHGKEEPPGTIKP